MNLSSIPIGCLGMSENQRYETPRELKIHLLSGAFSGIFSDMFVHPFDLAQTRIQTQQSQKYQPKLVPLFSNIIKKEGFSALWKGFETVALTSVPGHALYFSGYEISKKALNRWFDVKNDDSPLVHFLSGVSADVCGSVIYTPSEIIKQNLMVQQKESNLKYHNTFSMARKLIKEHGFRKGLFRGWWMHLASDGPAVAFYFMYYEQLKILLSRKILKQKSVDDLPFWGYLSCGAFAAGSLQSIFTPVDLIRTRLQVRMNNGGNYQGVLDVIKRTYKEEGLRAFYKGGKPAIIATSVGTAITMLACKLFLLNFR